MRNLTLNSNNIGAEQFLGGNENRNYLQEILIIQKSKIIIVINWRTTVVNGPNNRQIKKSNFSKKSSNIDVTYLNFEIEAF